MARIGRLIFSIFVLLVFCAGSHAQIFLPGKLVQIRKPSEYPFGLLTLDSIIGQSYYLTRPYLGFSLSSLSDVQRNDENRLLRIHANENRLRAIFRKQPNQITLLTPLVGEKFRILSYEYDTLDKYFHQLYILAQFQDGSKIVLPVEYADLLGTVSSLVPASILDSARRRWVGQFLWMNSAEVSDAPPMFSKVRVTSIELSLSSPGLRGPYEFHVTFGNDDTATLHCVLQRTDTSRYALKGTAFGQLFLDRLPDYYWKTVPDTGFAREGVALGEDSATFYATLHHLGVRITSYSSQFSRTGMESSMTLGLVGERLWGMPIDSATADFYSGKLSDLTFGIYDSANLNTVQQLLQRRYGQPSETDSLLSVGQLDTWMYYSSRQTVSSVTLLRMNSLLSALGKLASPGKTVLLPIAMVNLSTAASSLRDFGQPVK